MLSCSCFGKKKDFAELKKHKESGVSDGTSLLASSLAEGVKATENSEDEPKSRSRSSSISEAYPAGGSGVRRDDEDYVYSPFQISTILTFLIRLAVTVAGENNSGDTMVPHASNGGMTDSSSTGSNSGGVSSSSGKSNSSSGIGETHSRGHEHPLQMRQGCVSFVQAVLSPRCSRW